MDRQGCDTKNAAMEAIDMCKNTNNFIGLIQPKIEPKFEVSNVTDKELVFENGFEMFNAHITPKLEPEDGLIVKTETLVEDRFIDHEFTSDNISDYRRMAQTGTALEFRIMKPIEPKSENSKETRFVGPIETNPKNVLQGDVWSLDPQRDILDHTSFICHPCNETFKTKRALRIHMSVHDDAVSNIVILNAVSLKCNGCDFVGSSKENLVEHATSHDCENGRVGKRSLKIYEIKHKRKTFYQCSQCDVEYRTSGLLKQHLKSHDRISPFECAHCSCQFKTKCGLIKHLILHSGEKPYKCQFCNYGSNNSSNLKKHLITHNVKPYQCKFCDHSCGRSNSLKIHIMRHHAGTLPYKCPKCNLEFKYSSYLKKHSRVHEDRKRYGCTYCDYKCRTNSRLSQHLKTHTGASQYKCQFCDQICSRGNGLKKHVARFHSSDVKYQCSQCDLKFKFKSHLKKHSGVHK